MVERAALEMRCTHYVVPGVRIPHFPQSVEFGKLNKMQKGMEVIDFHFLWAIVPVENLLSYRYYGSQKERVLTLFPLYFV